MINRFWNILACMWMVTGIIVQLLGNMTNGLIDVAIGVLFLILAKIDKR